MREARGAALRTVGMHRSTRARSGPSTAREACGCGEPSAHRVRANHAASRAAYAVTPTIRRSFSMRLVAFAPLLLCSAAAFAASAQYTLDSRHSNVHFGYDYDGYARQVFAMHAPAAELSFDAADPTASTLHASVPISGISTGLESFDSKFQTAEYFDAASFPQATFTSTTVRVPSPGRLQVDGDLSLRGVSRPATMEVTLNKPAAGEAAGADTLGFRGVMRVRRSEFGLGMYGDSVGDEIEIVVNAIFKAT
ncbi:MAG: YceI family protein [Pseudomonadota bacterium]